MRVSKIINEGLQEAIDNLPDVGGRITLDGTYAPTIPILISNKKNLTIEGVSRGTAILQMGGGAKSFLAEDASIGDNTVKVADASGFHISAQVTIIDDNDLEVIHYITAITGSTITLSTYPPTNPNLRNKYLVANNARVFETNSMFLIRGSYNISIKNLTIDMNKDNQPEISPLHGTAIAINAMACVSGEFEGRLDLDLQNIAIKNVNNRAIAIYGGSNLNISNSYFKNIGEGAIGIDHGTAFGDETAPSIVTIIGNRLKNIGTREPPYNSGAITIEGTHTYAHGATICGNSMSNVYIGVHILPFVQGVTFTGNTIRKATSKAVFVSGERNNISGNTIEFCNIGIHLDPTSSSNLIGHNLIIGACNTAIQVDANSSNNILDAIKICGSVGSYCFYIRGNGNRVNNCSCEGLANTTDIFRVFNTENQISNNDFRARGDIAITTLAQAAGVGDLEFKVADTTGFIVGHPVTITQDDDTAITFVAEEIYGVTIKCFDPTNTGLTNVASTGNDVSCNETPKETWCVWTDGVDTEIKGNRFLLPSYSYTDHGTNTTVN